MKLIAGEKMIVESDKGILRGLGAARAHVARGRERLRRLAAHGVRPLLP